MSTSRFFNAAFSCAAAFVLLGAYHAGQRELSFAAPSDVVAQLHSASSIVHGIVWYPAQDGATEKPLTIGPPDHPLFSTGSAAIDVPIAAAPRRFPLIVVSHGTGGAANQMAWLGTALARAGYIAVAIDHPGNSNFDMTLQGTVMWWLRPRMLSVTIDRMLADPAFAPRIDTNRIGAAGFSIGGYSVLGLAGATVDMAQFQTECRVTPGVCDAPPEFPDLIPQLRAQMQRDPQFRDAITQGVFAERDQRVRAVYAIAPAVGSAITKSSLNAIEIPVRIGYGTNDITVPPKYNDLLYLAGIPGSTSYVIPNAAHYTFLDTCTPAGRERLARICTDPAGIDRDAVHAQTAADAIAFFQRTL